MVSRINMNNNKQSCLWFDGHIHYHNNRQSVDATLGSLLAQHLPSDSVIDNDKVVVGFDAEWVAFPRMSKVCLVQLCFDGIECHLIHLSAMDYYFPELLTQLLTDDHFIKVGLNIAGDFNKLQRDYRLPFDDIVMSPNKSVIDLNYMAGKLLGFTKRMSLSDMSYKFLGQPISKVQRLTNWSKNPLSDEQLQYAAIDAYASYELYYEIKSHTHHRQQQES
ncbi:bifunctional 3'-5' exonuclease/ATP-dependent helicase WRN-like [Oppia nitens]|uniref:bifunctional 3'-5' exonuclease/ATP-dependent helicase WRN-like n=1 Tax=Oppia nitens TaxID=1686743 RepID=UPI0023DACA83|nr:bifunctional 3'-5' exonuclease/ATP-dependent helicase WRN-like [Oppia nitens]